LLAVNCERRVFEAVAAVHPPSIGDARAAILHDLAVVCDARYVQAAGGGLATASLSDLGRARQAWASRSAFGVLGGRGARSAVRRRVAEARAELDRVGDDRQARNMTYQRIGKLAGLGATIRIGAATELEREELLLRTEAGVTAARLALQEGVVPGGGAALVACAAALRNRCPAGDEGVATSILAHALAAPMRTLAHNAGVDDGGAIVEEARRRGPRWTFDVVRGAWVDAWQAGLVDPLAVVRTALEASVSAACIATTTGALIRTRQARPPAGR